MPQTVERDMIAFGALQHIRQPTATARRTARMRRIKRRRENPLGADRFPILSENIQHRLRQMHRPHRGFCFRRADDIVRAERGVFASDAQLACRKVDVIPFQPEQLAAPHACGKSEEDELIEAFFLRLYEQPRDFFV